VASPIDFLNRLEAKVAEQLRSQRVGYLLGAGSSYLGTEGYPLACELWGLIKDCIQDVAKRAAIQAKLDAGATGLEHALDLLDDGGATDTPYRHVVTAAIVEVLLPKRAPLTLHAMFVQRLSQRADAAIRVFSLNYDPLMERAADLARVRLVDGFVGTEHPYFDSAVFEERIGRIRGTYRGRRFEATVRPVHLYKLHGSLGWYECPVNGVRRCAYGAPVPVGTKRLMIPPQRRKAVDTMLPPYSALWSAFRGCLGQDATPFNRLVCVGYGFADEHVNAIIDPALARPDFTLLIFGKELSDPVWARWSPKKEVILVTETRSSLRGEIGAGHPNLWSFERLCREV
jgi:hypothetical protein